MALLPHNLVMSNRAALLPQNRHALQMWLGFLPNKKYFPLLSVHFPVYHLGLQHLWCPIGGRKDEQRHPKLCKKKKFPDGLPHLSLSYTKRKIPHGNNRHLSDKRHKTRQRITISDIKAQTRKWDILYVWNRTSGEHTISWFWMKPLRGNGWF